VIVAADLSLGGFFSNYHISSFEAYS